MSIRDALYIPDSPIELKNGKWREVERNTLWQALGERILDRELDEFRELVITVLTKLDPRFDLPIEDRYAASWYGKTPEYSPDIRKGCSETLALLANRSDAMSKCSDNKPEFIAHNSCS